MLEILKKYYKKTVVLLASIFYLTPSHAGFLSSMFESSTCDSCLDIYTLNNGLMLRNSFVALGEIFSSSTFIGIASAGLLMGLMLTIIKGINSGKNEFQVPLVTMIAFMALFGIKQDVRVIDLSTSQTYEVRAGTSEEGFQQFGMPWGIAAMAWFSSNMGLAMTDLLEEHMRTLTWDEQMSVTTAAGMNTSGKVLGILGYLNDPVREKPYLDTLTKGNDLDTVYQFGHAFRTFIKSCYAPWVNDNIENKTLARKHRRSENFFESMEGDIPPMGTLINVRLPGQNGDDITCNSGPQNVNLYLLLKALTTEGDPLYEAYTKQSLAATGLSYLKAESIMPVDSELGSDFLGCAKDDFDCMSDSAKQALFSSDMRSSFGMILNAYYHSLEGQGWIDYEQNLNPGFNASLVSARAQKQAQAASDISFFEKGMPFILSFFEIFLYGVAPLVAIMFATGLTGGFQSLSKYLIMYFWLALFMPIMVLGNYFLTESIQAAGANFGDLYKGASLAGIPAHIEQLKEAAGIAAMMMAATPMLALMIVTGSYYAMSRLADQMSGSDHFNEKNAAPDLMSAESMVKMEGMGANLERGSEAYGYNVDTNYSSANQASNMVTNAETAVAAKSSEHLESAGSTVAQQVAAGNTSTLNSLDKSGFGLNYTGQSVNTEQQVNSVQDAYKTMTAGQESKTSAFEQSMGFEAKGGLKGMGMNLGGKANMSHKDISLKLKQAGFEDSKVDTFMSSISKAHSDSASLAKTDGSEVSAADSKKIDDIVSKADQGATSDSYKELQSAQQALSSATSQQENLSDSKQVDDRTMAMRIMADRDSQDSLAALTRGNYDPKMQQLLNSKREEIKMMGQGDPATDQKAETRAQLLAATQYMKGVDSNGNSYATDDQKKSFVEDVLSKGFGSDLKYFGVSDDDRKTAESAGEVATANQPINPSGINSNTVNEVRNNAGTTNESFNQKYANVQNSIVDNAGKLSQQYEDKMADYVNDLSMPVTIESRTYSYQQEGEDGVVNTMSFTTGATSTAAEVQKINNIDKDGNQIEKGRGAATLSAVTWNLGDGKSGIEGSYTIESGQKGGTFTFDHKGETITNQVGEDFGNRISASLGRDKFNPDGTRKMEDAPGK